MKRWLVVLAVVVAVVAVSALTLTLSWDAVFFKPGVTPENFARLHKGMTEEEVEAILGGPGEPGFYMTGCVSRVWPGPGCEVVIWFDGYGTYQGSLWQPDGSSTPLADEPEPLFAPLRKWLRTIGW